jgi:hypothetical protein
MEPKGKSGLRAGGARDGNLSAQNFRWEGPFARLLRERAAERGLRLII